jgi:hypothetical protein
MQTLPDLCKLDHAQKEALIRLLGFIGVRFQLNPSQLFLKPVSGDGIRVPTFGRGDLGASCAGPV